MTNRETEIYMLLCMAGRPQEAVEYRARCEKNRMEKQTDNVSKGN